MKDNTVSIQRQKRLKPHFICLPAQQRREKKLTFSIPFSSCI